MRRNEKIRNIAIIAHVDHGKTTLVNELLKQSGVFRTNEQVDERVMDSDAQEKERGITILAKNTSVMYKDIKINIVDTPGHADFGGEVERVLTMVDGVLLLVDAYEVEGVLELFIELGADDDQLDFPVIYASAKNGISKINMEDPDSDMTPLFESIITNIDAPNCDMDGTLQMLVSNIDYDDYVGRIAVGRVERGTIKKGMQVAICKRDDKIEKATITKIEVYQGLNKVTVEEGQAGDIITLSGINNINIGETICDENAIEKIDFVDIDEPTVSMTFSVNNGPFAGKEGKFITSRHLRDRLMKEMEGNIYLRVKETEFPDSFEVAGRGELHLTVLIENMRREGFELIVSRPKVIMKEINGVLSEPIEKVVIDAPSETIGSVIEKMGRRKGEMIDMKPGEGDFTRVEFLIPARRTYRL